MTRKSKFIAGILSFFPGTGHMYLGLFNRGLFFMSIFIFVTIMNKILCFDGMKVWITAPIIIYTFFDAVDSAGKISNGLYVPDDLDILKKLKINEYMNHSQGPEENNEILLNNQKERVSTIVGIFLIIIGVLGVFNVILSYIPWLWDVINIIKRYIVPVVFILLGIYILRKK